jgi:hypothetical protein
MGGSSLRSGLDGSILVCVFCWLRFAFRFHAVCFGAHWMSKVYRLWWGRHPSVCFLGGDLYIMIYLCSKICGIRWISLLSLLYK